MPFPLRRLFSTAGTNLYRGQPHSPRRNLRPRKCTCYIHPAPPPPCTDPSPPPSGPTGERTHNKRPGPATPSGRRLGSRSAASSDNDHHLARPLRPGSPLTTRRPGAPLARLPVSSAAVAPDKRGRCPRPGGRPHTAPPAGAGPGSAFRGTEGGRGGGGRGGAHRPSAPALPRCPAAAGEAGLARPPAGPPAGPPHCFRPQAKANHAPVRGETPPGVFVAALGPPSALSSPGWARPGRGAAGPGLGGGGRSAGVWAAAARAGMRLGRSSLKCGASHSLTPASLRRRAAAAAGALPFLVAHSLARPAPPSPPPRARPAPPPLQARRTHHGCAPGPRLPRPGLPRRPRCVWLDKPPDLPGPGSGCLETGGGRWWTWGPGERTWTGSEPGT